MPSLRSDIPLNRSTSRIYCTDCHSSNTASAAGGTGPDGPHGSTNPAMLTQSYSLDPSTPYSSSNYQLCYKCHSESKILSDASGFPHKKHLKSKKMHSNKEFSCSACHDPHGSKKSKYLINFMVSSNFGGNDDITPISGESEPRWQDDGLYKGRCYLVCHGETHNPETY